MGTSLTISSVSRKPGLEAVAEVDPRQVLLVRVAKMQEESMPSRERRARGVRMSWLVRERHLNAGWVGGRRAGARALGSCHEGCLDRAPGAWALVGVALRPAGGSS